MSSPIKFRSVPQYNGGLVRMVQIRLGSLRVGLGISNFMPEGSNRYAWVGHHPGTLHADHYHLRVLWLMIGFRRVKPTTPRSCRHEHLDMDGTCHGCGLGGAPSRR